MLLIQNSQLKLWIFDKINLTKLFKHISRDLVLDSFEQFWQIWGVTFKKRGIFGKLLTKLDKFMNRICQTKATLWYEIVPWTIMNKNVNFIGGGDIYIVINNGTHK